MKAWGLTVHEAAGIPKPLARAYEANHGAITRWPDDDLPTIGSRTEREQGPIYHASEVGPPGAPITGTGYAPVLGTPVILAAHQRFRCGVISVDTKLQSLAFTDHTDKSGSAALAPFVCRRLKQAEDEVYLLMAGCREPVSRQAKTFLSRRAERFPLTMHPRYRSHVDSAGPINLDVKPNGFTITRPPHQPLLMATVRSHLNRRQEKPGITRNRFRE